MDGSDKRSGGAIIGGAGTTIVSTVLSQAFPNWPVWIWRALLVPGLLLMAVGLANYVVHHRRLRRAAIADPYVPIEDAGRWLYAHASGRLKEWLKDMAKSLGVTIAEHGASNYRTSWQEGRCDLYGRWEMGLPLEKIDPKDGEFSVFDAVFGSSKRPILDQSIRREDLKPVLDFYESAATEPAKAPIKVRRDAPLREALMYAVTGTWGGDPWEDGDGHLSAISDAIEKTRQLAADGAIRVWGKVNRYAVWEEIAPRYWTTHYIDLLDVLRAETPTKAYNQLGNEPLFCDLMVSRAEFETKWPDL